MPTTPSTTAQVQNGSLLLNDLKNTLATSGGNLNGLTVPAHGCRTLGFINSANTDVAIGDLIVPILRSTSFPRPSKLVLVTTTVTSLDELQRTLVYNWSSNNLTLTGSYSMNIRILRW